MVNLRLLRRAQLPSLRLIIYFSFAVLYGSNVLLPQMLQELVRLRRLQRGAGALAGGVLHDARDAVRRVPAGPKVDAR